ncbi:Gcd10p-domain-containing protein [Clavulina sp. PMI_390]|nr:Gcd10p-domain-containing protein [Clavulina sp. PMI_390]
MSALKLNDVALLKLPTGEIRSIAVAEKAVVNFGKFGSFSSSELIGKYPGFTYEVVDRKLVIQPPKRIEELVDTDATNELITDGELVQPLTAVEIEALKKAGANATDIIKAQIEQHANYELKTEYSKDKYKKRKEAKFSKTVAIIEATMHNVCDYWFVKEPQRIRFMRPDALAQMVTLANACPGKRFIVADDTGGLVIASLLDRLGGQGRVLAITDVLHATSYPVLSNMNFTANQLAPLETAMNWLHTEEDWEPGANPLSGSIQEISKRKIAREQARLLKRREAFESLQASRDELFAGEWDGLLLATSYDPVSIIKRISPYLAGSANIVVHSPHLQVLSEAHASLRAMSQQFLSPSITECWLREYQVLPGRTHPTMSTSGNAGFILHVMKV